MYSLKTISSGTIDAAHARADRYRLLNEPHEAESISLDILAVAPDDQRALVMLLLSIADQFKDDLMPNVKRTQVLLDRLTDEYDRCYYRGLVTERWAKVLLRDDPVGRNRMVYDKFKEAMCWYEKAEAVRPPDNEESLLRWNTCARIIQARLASMSGEHHLEDLGISKKP